jgi:membrane-associated phospholipid phosphatase
MNNHPIRLNNATLLKDHWDWRRIIGFHIAAILLLISWLWQPSRALWNQLDIQIFHFLNAPLASHNLWARLWAVGSMRLADVIVGLIMLGFLIKGNWLFARDQVRAALFAFLSVLFLLLFIRIGLFAPLVKAMHWQHDGPSLVVDGAVRLGELFPGWDRFSHIKDSSNNSFPGDHASVVLLWAMFLYPFATYWQRGMIGVLTVIFLLPRLVAGAHWGTDIFIGGVFLSLITFSWGFYSPFAARSIRLLERFFSPILVFLQKIPGFDRISLIAGR